MNNFNSFVSFGDLILIDSSMTPIGGYNSTAKGLSKDIQQTYAFGTGLLCGNGVIAVECSPRGYDSRGRFSKMVKNHGGTMSPYAIYDRFTGKVWYLYQAAEERNSYFEPFTGFVNVLGRGSFVPLPGDRESRFTWLFGYSPASLEDLPEAEPWFFPNY